MSNKEKIRRVPVIGPITAGQSDAVVWSIDASENTQFEISFPPGRDPLEPGPNTSAGNELKRTVAGNAAKGKYQYRIRLLRTNEDVEGHSPPEMIIE